MSEGYIYIEVDAVNGIDRLTFRQADQPGAVVEVSLNHEIINVSPAALLAAARSLNPQTK